MALATVADVALLPTVTPTELQAAPVTEQTQIASPSLPAIEGQTAQSLGSEGFVAKFCRCGTHGIPRKEGRRPSLIRILSL